MPEYEKAMRPEDITRLFVERSNAGDAAGVAELYEENAVLAYPPGERTVGREAIRALWEKVLANRPRFEPEQPLPTLVNGDIALTSTPPKDGTGARAQVVHAATGRKLATHPRPAGVRAAGPVSGRKRYPVGHLVSRWYATRL